MERGSPAMPALRQVARAVRTRFAGPEPRLVPADADAVRAERDLCHQVISSATADAIFTTGEGGVITFFSEGAERLTGYTAAEAIGRMHGLDLHVADEIAAVARELGVEPGKAVFSTLARRGADTREWTFVRKDGSHVRVAHTVTVHRDHRGKVVGSVGVAHDISARHRSEQALRTSEERFRALSEHAPVGIVQTDEHANCWYANRRFCELVGAYRGRGARSGMAGGAAPRRPRGPARRVVAHSRGGRRVRRRVPGRPARRHDHARARHRRPDPG
jgi:PAS domain S-box-containing protein